MRRGVYSVGAVDFVPSSSGMAGAGGLGGLIYIDGKLVLRCATCELIGTPRWSLSSMSSSPFTAPVFSSSSAGAREAA